CSMHPQIRQSHPDACPICGMALVPAAASSGGDGSVQLAESSQRVASIEVLAVSRRPLAHELRTVGRIEFAEPLVAYVTARAAARVERVYADFTGTVVSAGDHLVDLYAPELVVAQQELLSSRAAGGEDLARRKLELLGVTAEQIDAVLAEGLARDVLTVHAPLGGTVIEKNVREQEYVQVGDPLYTIADLSTVWMFADIYEAELPWVAIGQHVEVRLEGLPGADFAGTVAFIEPVVREASRTVRVRVNLPNPDGRLKPGMFASAVIDAALDATGAAAPSPLAGRWVCPMHPDVSAEARGVCPLCGMDLQRVPGGAAPGAGAPAELLAVPVTAVLDSGLRQIVWVERQPGRYAAAEVRLGPRAGDFYPVLDGLSEGDRVVVHGNFLLDSQAQIEGQPSLLYPRGLDVTGAHGAHGGSHEH
ncbi:MAG TPA: efflux RND transporter periplasmic adaptor subunit, partial [Planctomycetota bacterium]|nr:efflux RND transporter periplasmic adaptor subunit [Planctomycetota bacterium]